MKSYKIMDSVSLIRSRKPVKQLVTPTLMTAMILLDATATPGMETITKSVNVLPMLSLFMFVANHHPADEYNLNQGC